MTTIKVIATFAVSGGVLIYAAHRAAKWLNGD